MGVRVVIQQIVGDGIDDDLWCLRATGRIEIRDRIIVVATLRRRKLLSNFFSSKNRRA